MTRLSLSWQQPAAGPTPPADSVASPAWRARVDAARCSAARGGFRVELPGCARFEFGPARDGVDVWPEPGESAEGVEEAFRGYVLPRALQALGSEVLHASASATPAGVVAWCGATGSGKSTLAFGLGRLGFPVWSDDLVAWTAAGGQFRAEPLAGLIRLRAGSAKFFGLDAAPAAVSPADRAAPLAALGVLHRLPPSGGEPALDMRRLSPARAFAALMPHAFCFDPHDPERRRRLVLAYLDLAARVPAWEVRIRPGWERFPEVLGRLADDLRAGSLTASTGG